MTLAVGLTFADDKKPTKSTKPKPSVGGLVIGENGKPQVGAEVRALRVDVRSPVITAQTDSTGRYAIAGLPVGAYSITACVDGFELSRANIKTRRDGWIKLDFDLRLQAIEGMNRMDDEAKNFIPNTNPH